MNDDYFPYFMIIGWLLGFILGAVLLIAVHVVDRDNKARAQATQTQRAAQVLYEAREEDEIKETYPPTEMQTCESETTLIEAPVYVLEPEPMKDPAERPNTELTTSSWTPRPPEPRPIY